MHFDLDEISDLERMAPDEIEAVKGLVSGLYGPFDEQVIIEGVYFWAERTPQMIYRSENSKYDLAICLPAFQGDNPLARLVHLSHELVHCLTPNGPPSFQATVLEEGLAEHAKIYLARQLFGEEYPDFDFRDMTGGDYLRAFDLVEELVSHEGLEGMRSGVRSLRSRTGLPFARLSAMHLSEQYINTPPALLDELSERFHS
ncbi:hypothetical protein CO666_14060 [Rhizobium chutanense]|uniref:Uncharacterized protein n=1 Tax=Rhizobium chutanense TaxID=2035448 RepID=A0A2A6JCX4_9HYPH|nr:hypothetical protein [Rhizobium chutanense]PDT03683.1 hypothetical protein CO666_14060 [Rhizobium chutanense]